MLLAGCSRDEGADGDTVVLSRVSSGFSVGEVPDGYRAVAAGRGTAMQAWGSDSEYTEEPFTVLAPDGSKGTAGAVVVSATGFAGYEGGLAQAGWGYWRDVVETTVDADAAVFTAGGTQHRGQGANWADLVVARGDDTAVRVTTRSATEERLADISRAVDTPTSRTAPPTLGRTVSGLEVVGTADANAVLALSAFVRPDLDAVPGPRSAHSRGWSGSTSNLAVMTLPGRSADIRALEVSAVFSRFRSVDVGEVTIGGRPALTLDYDNGPGDGTYRRRTVAVVTNWGDLLLVTSYGTEPAPMAALVEMAGSVRPISVAAWADVMAAGD